MRARAIRLTFLAVLGLPVLLLPASAQDFQKTYDLPAGGGIRVSNISGSVQIIGTKETRIQVVARKEGPDRDLLQIDDRSDATRISLDVRYPQTRNCNASVNFVIRVPASVNYNFDRLVSVSGNVEVTGVTGQIRADSVSGNVTVTDVSGLVSANAVSGNVLVKIARLQGAGEMSFRSISGNVNVTAPSNLDADVEMSTISGSLKTDFPIEVMEKRYGPGRSARGRLGAGSHNLRITTVSGRVSLVKL
jgi:hypothetical protein